MLLFVDRIVLKVFVVFVIFLNRLFVVVIEVEEFGDEFVIMFVDFGVVKVVNEEFINGEEVFLEVEVILGKKGFVLFVIEKVDDVELVVKLNVLFFVEVIEGVVVMVFLVLLREKLNLFLDVGVVDVVVVVVIVEVLKVFFVSSDVFFIFVKDGEFDFIFFERV